MAPAEFRAARDRHAKDATQAGDQALAKSVKQLRRPTTSAWLTNLLAREQPATVQQVMELGAELRQAQEQRRGDELRRLSAERPRVVAAGVEAVRRIARDLGQNVSDATAQEVQATLEAALADPGAADAVRSGLLTSALRYSGFGDVDVDPAFALRSERPARPAKPAPARAGTRRRQGRDDQAAADRATVTAARDAARAAEREVSEHRRRVRDVAERAEGLQRQLAALDEHRERIKREAGQAATVLRTAQRKLDDATRKLERLKARATEAGAARKRK